jgi:hypothetical protein
MSRRVGKRRRRGGMMSDSIINERVREATNKYEEAAQLLCEAVEEEYPVGTFLMAEMAGHKLELEVTGHSFAWWSRPGEMYGRNIKTSKDRSFYPYQVVS